MASKSYKVKNEKPWLGEDQEGVITGVGTAKNADTPPDSNAIVMQIRIIITRIFEMLYEIKYFYLMDLMERRWNLHSIQKKNWSSKNLQRHSKSNI